MNRRRRILLVTLVGCLAAIMPQRTMAAPVVLLDAEGDAVVRRTDDGANGPIDPVMQALPDLIEIRIDSFAPTLPHEDRFTGQSDAGGLFVRIDVVFAGLVNPPGPVGFDHDASYWPDRYGPNPVIGFIEFDVDANENTGGEVDAPNLRYLGNVARFGGLPSDARFQNRAATGRSSFQSGIDNAPFIESSGEEFHLVLLGEEVEEIDVLTEAPEGDPQVFEAGEVWLIEGDFFHKAHGYDDFASLCGSGGGDYEPEVLIQFAHDLTTDTTTLSLVFPKTNEGSARLISPTKTPQSDDGCDDNQFSIREVLLDLHLGALWADSFTRLLPEFQLIADWEQQAAIDDYLNPSGWRVHGIVGTAYLPVEADGDDLIWTDVFPSPIVGDVNGDGAADAADEAATSQFISEFDGVYETDTDSDSDNGSITLYDWGRSFSVFDVNYDGFIDALDTGEPPLRGDMNLDGAIDGRDIGPFVLAQTDPSTYALQFPSANWEVIGDINKDNVFDLGDVQPFLVLLLGPPVAPLMGDMNHDGQVAVDDISAFCMGITRKNVYMATFGMDPAVRGDLNGDGALDSRDIAHFVNLLKNP